VKESRPRALVITGYGINCDYETARACELAGFEAERVHLNDVLEERGMIYRYRLLVFPGGFSFGDDLGAGVAFAAKVRFSVDRNGERLFDSLLEYIRRDGLVLGVCNGFQILVRLGIIPAVGGTYGSQQVTLAPNAEGYFINRWVRFAAESNSPNVFTRGMLCFSLPVRHGEGRFLAGNRELLARIEGERHVALRYADCHGVPASRFPENPNGSENAIAGVCDTTGRVFGLMPHPEAAVSMYQYPDWTRKKREAVRLGRPLSQHGDGFPIFKNAFEYSCETAPWV
jgi:phosphoribosylformylglycinamidine synthase I